jgi:hypothetical protein
MYLVFILMALIFLSIGIAIKHFKWYFLISGYNTMTKEKKARVDIEKIGNIVGNFGFIIFLLQILAAILGYFGYELTAFIISFISILSGVLIVVIKSEKYDSNGRNPDGSLNKRKKFMLTAISLFFTAVIIGVSIMMYYSYKESEIIVGNKFIEIKGLYSSNILIDDISEVTLKDTIPRITARTNGSSIGSKLKGNFNLEGIGHAKLFIDKDKPPFIYIKMNQDYIIINLESKEATLNIYNNIKEHIK